MNSASLRVQPQRGFFTASKRLSYAVLYIYFLQPRRGFPTPFPTACMRLELILQGEGEVPARAEGAGGLFHLLGLAFGERIGAYLLIDHRFAYHILCCKADGKARGLGLGCLRCAMVRPGDRTSFRSPAPLPPPRKRGGGAVGDRTSLS